MRTFIITIPEENLLAFTRPALDLLTGEIIELVESAQEQLELPLNVVGERPSQQPVALGS